MSSHSPRIRKAARDALVAMVLNDGYTGPVPVELEQRSLVRATGAIVTATSARKVYALTPHGVHVAFQVAGARIDRELRRRDREVRRAVGG